MVTKVVESVMDHQHPQLTEDYVTFDPKLGRQSRLANSNYQSSHASSFTEAVVFVVGGGNYVEYQSLMEFAKVSGGQEGCCFLELRLSHSVLEVQERTSRMARQT
jgi:hypothetical protein